MASTEYKLLQGIADILRNNLSDPSRVTDELALLSLWSVWSDRRYGDSSFNKKQPDIRCAFESMAKEIGEVGEVFKRSRLHSDLSGAAIDDIIEQLNSIPSKSPKAMAEALVTIDELSGVRSNQMISLNFARFMVGLCGVGSHPSTLYHNSSAVILPALDAPEKATLRALERHLSPLAVAITYLLGTQLDFSDSAYDEIPEINAEYMLSVPVLAGSGLSKTSKLKSDVASALKVAQECTARAIACVAPSFLFSRQTLEVREELVNNNWLDAVIALPKGSLISTIVAPVLLVIDKNRSADDPIQFLEMDVPESKDDLTKIINAFRNKDLKEYGVLSSLRDIQDNSLDLSIHRYKHGQATKKLAKMDNTVLLDGVVEIVRAQSLKALQNKKDAAENFLEAAVQDITASGRLGRPKKKVSVDRKQLSRAQKQRIYPGDILLGIKGSIGRVAFVDDTCEQNWIAGQVFIVIRPKSKTVSTEYLFRYLASELVQEYLKEIETGAAMPMLKASDISNIPVPLPSQEEKEKIESNHQDILDEYKAIQEHYDTIRRLEMQQWTLNN